MLHTLLFVLVTFCFRDHISTVLRGLSNNVLREEGCFLTEETLALEKLHSDTVVGSFFSVSEINS